VKQPCYNELKVYIFCGHGLQACDSVIKGWKKVHDEYHVNVFICNVHLDGTYVTTLVLGSQSRQRGYKVASQEETQESTQRRRKGAGQEEA